MKSVTERCMDKRKGIMARYDKQKENYDELINHQSDVAKGIKVLEGEFLRIEGELRILEELVGDEDKERVKAKA